MLIAKATLRTRPKLSPIQVVPLLGHSPVGSVQINVFSYAMTHSLVLLLETKVSMR